MSDREPPLIALQLAARGIPVFPCNNEKEPTCKRGFKAAVTDAAAIDRLWHRNPGPLVGVPTGARSGVDVLDFDPKHGGDAWLETNQNRLPKTRVHQTRSGGEHWFFRHADGIRNSQGKLADGVDTRGEGGYVVWWPEFGGRIVCDAPPALWPEWLLALLLPKPKADAPHEAWVAKLSANDTAARRLIQSQLTRVANARPGERHKRLRNAALTIGGILAAEPVTSRSEIAAELYSAVRHAGGDDVNKDNAEATISWGLEKGADKPLRVGGRNG
jgi:hypothetical protein